MPSTYTSGLRLTNQANGENATTWGDLADNNFEAVDKAITGIVKVNMTGSSSYTLTTNNGTADEARSAVIEIYGIPTSANSIIIPASEKVYQVRAYHTSITGGITVRTNTGTGIPFLTGQSGTLECDGVSVYRIGTVSALDPSQNLGDLPNVSAAKVNLGLGAFASANISALGSSLQVVSGVLQVNTSMLYNAIWPIGSLYSNRTDGTNPGTLMGFGTWVSAGTGRVPIGVGTVIDANGVSAMVTAQACGGEWVHTIVTNEMAPHSHTLTLTAVAGDEPVAPTGTAQFGGDNISKGSFTATTSVNQTSASVVAMNIVQPWYSVYQWIRTA